MIGSNEAMLGALATRLDIINQAMVARDVHVMEKDFVNLTPDSLPTEIKRDVRAGVTLSSGIVSLEVVSETTREIGGISLTSQGSGAFVVKGVLPAASGGLWPGGEGRPAIGDTIEGEAVLAALDAHAAAWQAV